MSQAELKKDIKNKSFRNVYVFTGNESYLIDYYTNEIKKAILGSEEDLMNFTKLENEKSREQLIENCETLPIFAEKKVVLAKNIGILKSKNELIDYIANVPEHTCLIICEEKIGKGVKLPGNVFKVEFENQKEDVLAKWVINIFEKNGYKISFKLAQKIVDMCGPDMNSIHDEIDKIVLYSNGKDEITEDDVDKVCEKNIKSRVFIMIDAIAEKNAKKAYECFGELVELNENMPFALVLRMLKQLLVSKEMVECGKKKEVASVLGVPSFVADKIAKNSVKFTKEQLRELIIEIDEIDYSTKTGLLNEKTAMESLIARMLSM